MLQKELIIIGGGPSGLRAGEEAGRQGLDYLIIEQGKVGQAWHEIRTQLPMLSPSHPQRDWTSISPRFPIWKLAVKRPFCSAGEFANYLQSYAEHFNLQLMIETRIKNVQKMNDHFVIDSERGIMAAKIVIVCTGMFGNPHIPDIPGLRNNPRVMHSHFYQNPDAWRGKRVIILGGGNSGVEIAIDLAGWSKIYLITRGPLKFFSRTKNLCDIRGISASYLLELIAMQLIQHLQGVKIHEVKGNTIQVDRTALKFDQIICATGYKPVLNILSSIPLKLNRKTSFPLVTSAGETQGITNLFFAGPLAYHSMGSLFIHGFIKDIPKTMQVIKNRLRSKGLRTVR